MAAAQAVKAAGGGGGKSAERQGETLRICEARAGALAATPDTLLTIRHT